MTSQIGVFKTEVLLVVVGVAVCSTGAHGQSNWVNPGVAQQQQQQRFRLDATECMALANQMIPEPSPPPQPQSGNIILQTPSGPVYGTYQSQPPVQQGFQPDGFLGGMQRGQRVTDRREYVAACMGNRGWQPR